MSKEQHQSGLKIHGKRIADMRKYKELTQDVLASWAGISAKTISRMENGESVDLENVRLVAKALEVPSDFFVEMTDQPKSKDDEVITVTITISVKEGEFRQTMGWDKLIEHMLLLMKGISTRVAVVGEKTGSIIIRVLIRRGAAAHLPDLGDWGRVTSEIDKLRTAMQVIIDHGRFMDGITNGDYLIAAKPVINDAMRTCDDLRAMLAGIVFFSTLADPADNVAGEVDGE